MALQKIGFSITSQMAIPCESCQHLWNIGVGDIKTGF